MRKDQTTYSLADKMQNDTFQDYRATAKPSDVYSDFNNSFLPHPNTGQIARKTNLDSIQQALRNLILTNKYERIRNPRYGTNLRRYLFENHLRTTNMEIRQHIENAIKNYEPRVKVNEVIVESKEDSNQINVSIHYYAIIAERESTLNLTLYRVR